MRRIFILADVQSILNIPLSSRLPHDRLVWAYTPKGRFTIRSAYKLAVTEFLAESTTGSSNADTHKTFWRRLWGLNLPNKIKSFAWIVCRNILLTKMNLCQRQVIDEARCEACVLGEESSGHAFWECGKA